MGMKLREGQHAWKTTHAISPQLAGVKWMQSRKAVVLASAQEHAGPALL